MTKHVYERWIRITQYISNMKLQTKLVASYFFIILVPIIIFSTYMFNDFYKNTIKDTITSNQNILDMEYSSIANNIDLMERTAQLMLTDEKVQEYMLVDQELDVDALIDFSKNVIPNLVRLQFNNPNIAHIRLYSGNSKVKEIWPIFLNKSRIVSKPWHDELVGRKGLELWEFDSEDKDVLHRASSELTQYKAKISLLREINYSSAQQAAGIVQIDMYLDDFFSKAFSSVQDNQSRVLLLDRHSRFYFDDNFSPDIPLDELRQRLQSNLNGEKTNFELSYNGIPYICIYKKLDLLDAYLINVVSLEAPLNKVHSTRDTLILVSLTLTAILSLITYLTSSIIFKRLRMLQNSMKRVRSGDLQVNIDVHGGGEVGEIAHHFKLLMKKINGLIADAVNKQAAAKEAELNALKNQIDSHFLYNTLENLKMLAEVEAQYMISDSLTSLGGMMRYNLQWTSNYVQLRDEISHIRNYISIMNIRYDDRISLQLFVQPKFMEQEILKMSLQPIIENAVKHGLQTTVDGENLPLLLTINVQDTQNATIIEIVDNGKGMSLERVQYTNQTIRMNDLDFRQLCPTGADPAYRGNGIGLRNVNQRVEMNYGSDYGIQLQSVEGRFTSVSIKLPKLILAEGGNNHAQAPDC